MAAMFRHAGIRPLLTAWLAVGGLMASEYHGAVQNGGTAIAGATVTATQTAEKFVTTDEKGTASLRWPTASGRFRLR